MNVSVEWIGYAGISLCVLAYFPQIVHLIKERCSAGLSLGAYCLWGIAAILLLAYAIVRRDIVFVSLQSYQAGATALIFYYCLRYRGHLCDEHGGEPSAIGLDGATGEVGNMSKK